MLIYVRIGSALIIGILGHAVDTGVIVGVVIIKAVFGVLQEGKSERALQAIRSIISPQASVLRDLAIDAAHVVPGDILLPEAGTAWPLTCASTRRVISAVLTITLAIGVQ